jgi:hypothetical protein
MDVKESASGFHNDIPIFKIEGRVINEPSVNSFRGGGDLIQRDMVTHGTFFAAIKLQNYDFLATTR